MKIKNIIEYDIVNYKCAAMFIGFPTCTFKCDKDCGRAVCQNSALAKEPIIEMNPAQIIERYLKNPLTHAVVCGGLEPFDSWKELQEFIFIFRYWSKDPIIIYTGYKEEEIPIEHISWLKLYSNKNIIIKYGRFIPNSSHIYDEVQVLNLPQIINMLWWFK